MSRNRIRNVESGQKKGEQCGAFFLIRAQEVHESERRRRRGRKQEVSDRRGESCRPRRKEFSNITKNSFYLT